MAGALFKQLGAALSQLSAGRRVVAGRSGQALSAEALSANRRVDRHDVGRLVHDVVDRASAHAEAPAFLPSRRNARAAALLAAHRGAVDARTIRLPPYRRQ